MKAAPWISSSIACAAFSGAAFADCPDRLQRDPAFVALAAPDGAPRAQSAEDFRFVGDTTTLEELQAKVGPPDGTKGARRLVWCPPDGKVVEVESRTGTDIKFVRVNGKAVYKRK